MDQQNEKISGTVGRFVFKSADDAFVIFVLEPLENSSIASVTVRGYLPSIAEGQDIALWGAWTVHPKFGKQFNAHHAEITLPTSLDGLRKYLGSGIIKGIGPAYAEKLVDFFGIDVLNVIDTTPHKLLRVEGIGEKRAADIIAAWQKHKEVANLMVFLQSKGISTSLALKIYKQYGNNAVANILENPYRLAGEVWGIGFLTADQIAQNLGIKPDDPRRVSAGILFVLSTASGQGHLYVEQEKLKEKASEILALKPEQMGVYESSLSQLFTQGKTVLIPKKNHTFIGLALHFNLEQELVRHCKRVQEFPTRNRFDLEKLYQGIRVSQKNLELHEDQQQGIMTALSNKITIITGGPGTGKTTLVRTLLGLLDEEKCNYRLAAPTGRASKRLAESTGRFATTIHRLLEFKPETGKFVHDDKNTLKVDFLVVDETSMIDIFLAVSLFKAIPSSAQILLIGDCDQLPSVGPGNILKDFIKSGRIPCVTLTKIFRQAQSSLITVNAHRIRHGEFPTTAIENSRRDFAFMKMTEPAHVGPFLQRLFSSELKKRGFKSEDVQILTPMNRGIVGTYTLNNQIQNLIFPEKRTGIAHNGAHLHVGDRVMQLRNNYDKNVFNGDIGTVETLDQQNQSLHVRYPEGTMVEYESTDLDELVLAYATTIHKSQGSEYPVVVIPIFMQHFMLLQRNLLYTAVTRAQKLCVLIGEPRAIAMAIHKEDATQRATFLMELLQK